MASITGDTLQEQIQKAISAHGVYKFKLSRMVEAESGEIQPPTAAADNLCPVGQWLYEGLAPAQRSGEHYRSVVELHARFHRAAGEVAALSFARRRTEALEAMELTSSFKKTSDQLVAALEAWAEFAASPAPAAATPVAARPAGPELIGNEPVQAETVESEPVDREPVDSDLPMERQPIEAEPIGNEPIGNEPIDGGLPSGGDELVDPDASEEADREPDIDDWFGLPRSGADDGRPQ